VGTHGHKMGQSDPSIVRDGGVDGQKRQRGQERKDELIFPTKIQDVIRKTEQHHTGNRQQCSHKFSKLSKLRTANLT
jgi:hypothetical protein